MKPLAGKTGYRVDLITGIVKIGAIVFMFAYAFMLWFTWWQIYLTPEKSDVIHINRQGEAGRELVLFFATFPLIVIGVYLILSDIFRKKRGVLDGFR